MRKIEEICVALKKLKPEIREKFKVNEIGVFGSYVREEENVESDLDILVSFQEPVGFFTFFELEEYLSNALGIKVDLVSKKALKPRIGKRILEQVIMV